MTYLPTNCFKLIKSFAGFDPTYRHKKIASFIRGAKITHTVLSDKYIGHFSISTCATELDYYSGLTFPDVKEYRRMGYVGLIKTRFRYETTSDGTGDISNLPKSTRTLGYHWRGGAHWTDVAGRGFNAGHISLERDALVKPHILFENRTLNDLKQYCRINKMKGFSKHNKTGLKRFIMKYNFD